MFEMVWFEFEFDHVVGGKFIYNQGFWSLSFCFQFNYFCLRFKKQNKTKLMAKDFEVYHFVLNLIIFVWDLKNKTKQNVWPRILKFITLF